MVAIEEYTATTEWSANTSPSFEVVKFIFKGTLGYINIYIMLGLL